MSIDLIFLAKAFLLIYIWALIVFCIWLILNSSIFFQKLKNHERFFANKKRETILHLIPSILDISRKNKSLQTVLGIKKSSIKEIIELTTPFICNLFSLFLGARLGLNQLKKLLR